MCFYDVAIELFRSSPLRMLFISLLHQSFTQVWFICFSCQILISSWLKKGNARETEIETEMCWREELLPVFCPGENTSTDTVKCPLTPDLHSNCCNCALSKSESWMPFKFQFTSNWIQSEIKKQCIHLYLKFICHPKKWTFKFNYCLHSKLMDGKPWVKSCLSCSCWLFASSVFS